MEESNILKFEGENVKTEATQVAIEDYCYRFDEMKDAMTASVDNISKIIKEQTRLIEIVEAAEDAKDFEQFINESKEQITSLDEQRSKLNRNIGLLTMLLDKCREDASHAETVSLLSEILGLFR